MKIGKFYDERLDSGEVKHEVSVDFEPEEVWANTNEEWTDLIREVAKTSSYHPFGYGFYCADVISLFAGSGVTVRWYSSGNCD